jgi:biuret amidohydrolase
MLYINAQPYTYCYEPEHTALVLIDFQRDFLLPGGFGESLGNDVTLLQKAVEPTKKVLELWRNNGLPIFHIREGHQPDLSDCPAAKQRRGNLEKKIGDKGPMGRILIRGEYGHGIIDELTPLPGEPIIDKPGKCAFYATDLHEQLQAQAIRYFVFTGVTTEVCTLTTFAAANDRGYEPLCLRDCVASYKPRLHEAALQMIISQGGIFGWVTESKELLASL